MVEDTKNIWPKANLLDVCDVKTGKVDANHAAEYGEYTFFTCALEPFKSNTFSFDGELIILPGNGANVGHVGYYKGKIEAYQRTYILHHIHIIPKYLYYSLLKNWRRINAEKQFGSATNYIKMGNFESYSLSLPPLAEQKVIADKLDELLAQVDTLKARLDAIPAILKRFRQSVLAAAVSGKLTEEWRVDHSELLAKWRNITVGDIALVATGTTPKRTEKKYWENGEIPWLSSAATGYDHTYAAEQYVTKAAVKECRLKIFPAGTLLLAMYGEGKTRGQVTEIHIDAACNQACAAIIPDRKKVTQEYIKLRLLENYEQTRKAAAGGAQPNLNLKKVREIPISLPTISEQTEIVRRVEQLLTYADQVEQQVKNAQARVNQLTQSILAKAFRGELTEQWRQDNPELISGDNSAAALLERIKAERTAAKPARKKASTRTAKA